MKATDFRPEHFEKGRSFNRKDFNAYVQASEKLAKTAYTRYLPSVAVGLILGLLFSRGVGGFGGNILALVCIFAGLIVGAVFNVKAGKAVNALAQSLGISKADVARAREHVKNGTFAWTGGGEEESQEAVPAPADIPTAVLGGNQAVPSMPEKPMRAVWAAVLAAVGWFLLAVIQLRFGRALLSSSAAYICLASAILGAAVYLLAQSGWKWRLAGAGTGLVSILLLASSEFVGNRLQVFGQRLSFSLFFSFRDPIYMRSLGNVVLAVLLCLAAVLLYTVLRKEEGKNRERLCGAIAGAVYLAARLLPRIRLLLSMFSHPGIPARQILTQQIYPVLTAALVIFLICMAIYALCHMQTRVKLRGLGLVWAWLALAGSVFTIFLVIRVGAVSHRVAGIRVTGVYAHQLILGLSALIGYALLLCKRRVGLYFILLGVGLMLGAQLVSTLSNLGLGPGLNMLLSTLLGALNPLFAWLAVRAGETPE